MAGYYAIADPAEPVRTDLDNELEGINEDLRRAVLDGHLWVYDRCAMAHS